MVQHVNGFACYNPADAALARRGVNPAAPSSSLASSQAAAAAGSLSTGLQPSARSEPAQLSAPRAGRGQFIDLVA